MTKTYVYDTISDPIYTEDGWRIDILYYDEEGLMQQGSVALPTKQVGDKLLEYFRTNVNPLDDTQLSEFIEKHRRRTMQ